MPRRIHTSHDFQGDVYKFLHVFIPAATTQHRATYDVSPKQNTAVGRGSSYPQKDAQKRTKPWVPGVKCIHGKSWHMARAGSWIWTPPTLPGCSHLWHPVPLWGSLRRHSKLILGLGREAGLPGWGRGTLGSVTSPEMPSGVTQGVNSSAGFLTSLI